MIRSFFRRILGLPEPSKLAVETIVTVASSYHGLRTLGDVVDHVDPSVRGELKRALDLASVTLFVRGCDDLGIEVARLRGRMP
jgi:hypothetical protein